MRFASHDDNEVEVGMLVEAAVHHRAAAEQRLDPAVAGQCCHDAFKHAGVKRRQRHGTVIL